MHKDMFSTTDIGSFISISYRDIEKRYRTKNNTILLTKCIERVFWNFYVKKKLNNSNKYGYTLSFSVYRTFTLVHCHTCNIIFI